MPTVDNAKCKTCIETLDAPTNPACKTGERQEFYEWSLGHGMELGPGLIGASLIGVMSHNETRTALAG